MDEKIAKSATPQKVSEYTGHAPSIVLFAQYRIFYFHGRDRRSSGHLRETLAAKTSSSQNKLALNLVLDGSLLRARLQKRNPFLSTAYEQKISKLSSSPPKFCVLFSFEVRSHIVFGCTVFDNSRMPFSPSAVRRVTRGQHASQFARRKAISRRVHTAASEISPLAGRLRRFAVPLRIGRCALFFLATGRDFRNSVQLAERCVEDRRESEQGKVRLYRLDAE